MQNESSSTDSNHSRISKIIPRLRPKFYQILNNIANRLVLKDTDGSFTKRYLNMQTIPYVLQNQHNCKAIFVKSYRYPREIINFPSTDNNSNKTLIIHVTEGVLEINNGKFSELFYAPSSHYLNIKSTDIFGSVLKTPTNFTIVIEYKSNRLKSSVRKVTPIKETQHEIDKRHVLNNFNLTPLPNNLKPTPKLKNKNPISYIRTEMSEDKMNERIIFLDAEFVKTESKHSVGSVTMINFNGEIIFNKIIKPYERIIDYMSFITGFNKNIIDKGMPEKEALELIQKILIGKILVGSDLSQDIKVLEINVDNLVGIRDLSTARILRYMMCAEEQRMSLAKMVNHFWNIKLHCKIHSSLEDAKYIRDIYLKIMKNYTDDFYSPNLNETYIVTSSDETDSFGTPLLDEVDLDCDVDMLETTEYSLDPVSDEELQTDEISDLNKNKIETPLVNIEQPEYITVNIPLKIRTDNGKILKPEFILYSDTNENFMKNNKQPKISLKFFPEIN